MMNKGSTITVMQEKDEIGRDYFRRIDPLRVDNVEDVELAYALQNAARDDPALLALLINRYAGEVYRWAAALLYYQQRKDPTHDEIMGVLQHVFSHAIHSLEQFHGQASVIIWLFGITRQTIKCQAIRDEAGLIFSKITQLHNELIQPSVTGWANLQRLPEKQRSALVLRYLFGMGLADIANTLGLQIIEVQRRLAGGRKKLLVNPYPSRMDDLIHAYLDGMYDDNPDERHQITQHIESCKECQASMLMLESLEKSLITSLREHWQPPSLDREELDKLTQSILLGAQKTNGRWQSKIKIGQVAWILGISTLFVAMAILFVRLTPPEREFPLAGTTQAAPTPTAIMMQSEIASPDDINNPAQIPQYIDPAISADGNWVVFSSIRINFTTQRLGMPTVNLYDRQNNTIKVISESSQSMQLPWVWWDLAPSISADGNRIVYVSSIASGMDISGAPCETPDQHACLDIFLYDRDSGTSRRITQAANGGPADGDSLAPTISALGQWVAFWSAADNLIGRELEPCQQSQTNITCLYLYLYNIESENMLRVPMGIDLGGGVFGADRISLSADGRYVGFTATPAEEVGSAPVETPNNSATPDLSTNNPAIPTIDQSTEAIVFDQRTGQFELQNQAQDGTPGNGPSTSPALSADGRYVAFASASSNLVVGDDNSHFDVFVRDRQTGAVELVSVSTHGVPGNNHSGITFYPRGFYSINISSDGRYVMYQSLASNLDQGANTGCGGNDIPSCINLYIHDRQTHITTLISAVPDLDYAFFPGISADGHWMVFTQGSYTCSPGEYFCSNVMLYDSSRGWMTRLTNYNVQAPSLDWTYGATLTLPWEAWESPALSFSPDDKLLALGSYDSKIRLWNVPTGINSFNQATPDMTITSPGNDTFSVLAFSRDNKWLAAGTIAGVVYIWDLSNNKLLYTLNDAEFQIMKVVFSQDKAHIIISTMDDTRIWTIGNGALIQETIIPYVPPAIYALEVSPQGNLMATGRADGTIWLQSLPGGEVVGRLAQGSIIRNLEFSPDGTMLAAHSFEGDINLWQVLLQPNATPTIKLVNRFQSAGHVGSLVFSPDNKYLASTGQMGEMILWRVPDGKMFTLTSPGSQGTGYASAFSNSGDLLAVVFENVIDVWGLPPDYASTYFTHSTQDVYSDSSQIPLLIANDIPEFYISDVVENFTSLDQVAPLLKFPLIVPTHLPENLTFLGATINRDGSAVLRYVSYSHQSYEALLYIYEQVINNAAPRTVTVGRSADISLTQIDSIFGRALGEYVSGDWKLRQNIAPPQPNESFGLTQDVWVWDATDRSQRMRWNQNGILVAFYYQVDKLYSSVLPSKTTQPGALIHLSSILDQSDLVQIANGMDWYSQANTGLIYNLPGQPAINPTIPAGTPLCGQFCLSLFHRLPRHIAGGSIVTK